LTSPTDKPVDATYADWFALRPRDRMFLFALDRLASLEARAKIECLEPSCGTRDDEGVHSCTNSKNCGEKLMLAGWRRELQAMRDVKALVEGLERREQELEAAKDRRGKR
jgi:hypothetical protein